MSFAIQTMEIFEGPCPETTRFGCGACLSCTRRIDSPIFAHSNLLAARELRSGRQYLPSGCYDCESLPDLFIHLFTQPAKQDIQTQALQRWHEWVGEQETRPYSGEGLRDLTRLTRILDDYFFQGALAPYIRLSWLPFQNESLGVTTTMAHEHETALGFFDNDPHTLIMISLPPSLELREQWAWELRMIAKKKNWRHNAWLRRMTRRQRVEDIACGMRHRGVIGALSTLLQQLGHAAFMVFGCQACCMRGSVGKCGHGEPGRRFGEALERQANLVLTGMGTWRLG